MSVFGLRYEKPGGITPITVKACPSSVMPRPTTPGSPPKRRCQKALLSRTTLRPPGRSSASVNTPPTAGETPRTRKRLAVTISVLSFSGSETPVRLTLQ